MMNDCVVLRRKGKRTEVYPFGSLARVLPMAFNTLRGYSKRIEQREWSHKGKDPVHRFGFVGTYEDE